jgi:hypothetical protein
MLISNLIPILQFHLCKLTFPQTHLGIAHTFFSTPTYFRDGLHVPKLQFILHVIQPRTNVIRMDGDVQFVHASYRYKASMPIPIASLHFFRDGHLKHFNGHNGTKNFTRGNHVHCQGTAILHAHPLVTSIGQQQQAAVFVFFAAHPFQRRF